MTGRPARVIALGIDAANPVLLQEWAADGTLPVLASLIQRGVSGPVRGLDGFFVGSTWPSLYTGTSPARHGFHYQLQLAPGTYQLQRAVDAGFVRQPALWRALSEAGRRVAILDVPLSQLDPAVKGVQTVEWGAHDAMFGARSQPPELLQHLIARHGAHPAGPSCDATRRTAEDYATFLSALESGVARKAAWTCELLAQGGWDLFMQVFTESHCAGHQCWHLHDAAHPAHDPGIAVATGDPLRRVYRAIDAALGDILALAPGARVLVFTAHGMAHRFGAQFLLRDILCRLGVAVLRATPPDSAGARLRSAIARVVPQAVRDGVRQVERRVTRQAPRARVPSLSVDAARSQCFPAPNGLATGGIRLNLRGREPAGLVAPGAEAEALVRRLEQDLPAIVDAGTGRPLVRRVIRTAALYEGEHLDRLPDVLVDWNEELPLGTSRLAGGASATVRASSAAIGSVEGTNDYPRTGEHRRDGWFVAAGPGIGHGAPVRDVALLDLAPTLAAMLGVAMPSADGRVVEELVQGTAAGNGKQETGNVTN